MSEIILIFTIIILSSSEIKLISERVNAVKKTTEGKSEYIFPNTQKGFSDLQMKTSSLKEIKNDPSKDCIFNLNQEEKGFLKVSVPNSFKGKQPLAGLSHSELANLCKNTNI